MPMKSSVSLSGKNIVITGASSGIGKATALYLAREGANLILAARRELLLDELAIECEKFGVRAVAFKTDVTKRDEVSNLFEFALVELGSIDIWINNAGVGSIGEFEKTPLEVHERVIQTNLMGYLYGAYKVIPYFKSQNRGILINNISLGAFVPNSFATAYSASKFGIRGFSEALKYELVSFPGIHVCDVFPAFIDTPGFLHGANFSGKELRPAPPVYDPFMVAERIVSICKSPRDRSMVGNSGRIARLTNALAPKLMGHSLAKVMQKYFKEAKETDVTVGNLFKPVWRGAGVFGGWKKLHPRKKISELNR